MRELPGVQRGGSPQRVSIAIVAHGGKSYSQQLPQACELSAKIRTPQGLMSLRGSLRSWGCPPGLLFGVELAPIGKRHPERTYATKKYGKILDIFLARLRQNVPQTVRRSSTPHDARGSHQVHARPRGKREVRKTLKIFPLFEFKFQKAALPKSPCCPRGGWTMEM